jgi:acetolactate synthase-1/2/3 large subunit
LKKFHELYDIEYEEVIRDQVHANGNGLTMAETIMKLNELTGGDAVIVTDVGQHQMVACRYSKFNNSRSKVTSGGLGTMGFALPAAIGAKMGAPEREVIAIMGDGGLQMNIQELGTVLQTGVPVKVVVLNNQFLGMVRQWQELFFESRYASTVMTNPDFVKIADGYGIQSKRVTERKDLESAMKEMVESKNSYFLEVVVEMEENVFPMIPSGASVSDIRLK